MSIGYTNTICDEAYVHMSRFTYGGLSTPGVWCIWCVPHIRCIGICGALGVWPQMGTRGTRTCKRVERHESQRYMEAISSYGSNLIASQIRSSQWCTNTWEVMVFIHIVQCYLL